MNVWSCRNWRRTFRNMAAMRDLLRDADEIVQTIAPEMRSGDVVAILSNGGFGGIYEKLPARLRALATEGGSINSANAAGK